MGKAYRQTLAMLAVANGVLLKLNGNNLIPEYNSLLLYGIDVCKDTINKYPEEGKPQSNTKWAIEKVRSAGEALDDEEVGFNKVALAYIGINIVTDLMETIRNPRKREVLKPLFEVMVSLSGFIDPEGDHFDDYGLADEALDVLYTKIEFSR